MLHNQIISVYYSFWNKRFRQPFWKFSSKVRFCNIVNMSTNSLIIDVFNRNIHVSTDNCECHYLIQTMFNNEIFCDLFVPLA